MRAYILVERLGRGRYRLTLTVDGEQTAHVIVGSERASVVLWSLKLAYRTAGIEYHVEGEV